MIPKPSSTVLTIVNRGNTKSSNHGHLTTCEHYNYEPVILVIILVIKLKLTECVFGSTVSTVTISEISDRFVINMIERKREHLQHSSSALDCWSTGRAIDHAQGA